MSEKQFSTPPASAAAGQHAGGIADLMRRVARYRRFFTAFAAAGLISIGLYAVVYLRMEAWQLVVLAGATLLGLLLATLGLVLARSRRVNTAGYISLIALVLVYAAAELVWSHATPYLAASGVLLILVVGGALLPHNWGIRLFTAGVFGLFILLTNQLEPLPRLDIRQSPLLRVLVPGGSLFLSAICVWQAILAYRRVTTIRARLLALSITTVLLTAVAISAATILIGFRDGREQAIDRLELVTSLRESALDRWISGIKATLSGSLQQAPEYRFVEPEMSNVVTALLDTPPDSQAYQDAYDFLDYNFEQWLKQAQSFEVVFFMDRDGKVLISTDSTLEGQSFAEEPYFNRGTVGSFIAPPVYDDSLDRVVLFVSRPILGEYGRLLGVLAGRVDGAALDRLMHLRERESLGETGETYLVGQDYRMLTNARFHEVGATVRTRGVRVAIEEQEAGADTYENYQGSSVIGVYHWIPDLRVALLAEQSRAEAFRAVNRTAILNASIAFVAVLAAAGVSLSIARSIGDPLSDLAQVASDIAAGDLARTAKVERRDEIGTLAEAFNTMTTRLRGLIGQLEQRVTERTRELETRSAYLEASAEVGHAASTVLKIDDLIRTVVELVNDRFDFYYVGLFLLDELGEWAELRAGTGDAGKKMLAQGHRLKVGGESMIGQCVARREARIALDVGEEAVHFDNPLLPETRSEAALPLKSRGRIFGAMTVQSNEAAAFDDDAVTVLQTMADQVAVALDNAYLFAEAEESLQAARRASVELSREAWTDLLRSRPKLGYHSDERGVIPAEDHWRPAMEEAVRAGRTIGAGEQQLPSSGSTGSASRDQPLAVPIKVAGKVIGVLDTHKPEEAGPWTDEEIETLESLVAQMAVSLESARLYQETQSRAAREQMVAEITSRLRSSLDPDTILKTAVRELGRALDANLASVRLKPPLDGGNGGAPDHDRSGSRGEE
jgi:GAF domain-containing protein/HAMP domain-containing protein